MIWISLNLVLFRFHFQGGLVKLQSRDPNWRNLTATAYHYQSQPIPNKIAWYVHKFPMWFHQLSTGFMFVIELVIPFAIFGNDFMRLCAFFAFIGLQVAIWATGNFSYLNHLTVVLSSILIANIYLSWLPTSWFTNIPEKTPSFPLEIFCSLAGSFLLGLQLIHLWQQIFFYSPFAKLLNVVAPFHIANRYGIFAIMTTTRYEVIFEGSENGVDWKEYSFFYKPSEIERSPRRISPYQPRLDWQAWFLPLGNYYRHEEWFGNFIYHLLKGTPEVLALIRVNPFPKTPPLFLRTLVYEYTFSSVQEKKTLGIWWKRKYIDVFTKPVSLNP